MNFSFKLLIKNTIIKQSTEAEVRAEFSSLELSFELVRCDCPHEMNVLDEWIYRREEE